MAKNFGVRKTFRGHIVKEKELQELAKEYASSVLQALALNHPIRLVTSEKAAEIGLPFFVVQSPELELPKFTTTAELREMMLTACRIVVSEILKLWDTERTGPIFMMTGSQVALTFKDDMIKTYVGLSVTGAIKSAEALIEPVGLTGSPTVGKEDVPTTLQLSEPM